jgi:hypothetical protein
MERIHEKECTQALAPALGTDGKAPDEGRGQERVARQSLGGRRRQIIEADHLLRQGVVAQDGGAALHEDEHRRHVTPDILTGPFPQILVKVRGATREPTAVMFRSQRLDPEPGARRYHRLCSHSLPIVCVGDLERVAGLPRGEERRGEDLLVFDTETKHLMLGNGLHRGMLHGLADEVGQ